MTDDDRFRKTKLATKNNDPPIKPKQIWLAKDETGVILRRIRILGQYPEFGIQFNTDDVRLWFYEAMGGLMRGQMYGEIGTVPEFNLRYVFDLERDSDENTDV